MLAAALLTAICAPAWAQTTETPPAPTTDAPPATDTAALEAEVAELRERLRVMEGQLDAVVRAESQATAAEEIPVDLETRVYGFADVALSIDHSGPPGFGFGELLFNYQANLDRNMHFLTELEFEAEDDGIEVRVERLELDLQPRPGLGVRVGWVYSPWSIWASEGVDGSYRFLPTRAPEVFVEEGEEETFSMPSHQMGAWLVGRPELGLWQVNYQVGIANGRSPFSLQQLNFGDLDLSKSVGGRAWITAPAGWTFGPSVSFDLVKADSAENEEHADEAASEEHAEELGEPVPFDYNELILAWAVDRPGARLKLRAEVFGILHSVDGETYATPTGYLLVGVPRGDTTPYVIGEFNLFDADDPVYPYHGGEVASRFGGSLGLRRELGLHLAGKLQAGVIGEREAGEDWHPAINADLLLSAGF